MTPFQPTGFSETIFKGRYALTPEETWEEACRRVARQLAIAEVPEKQKIYEEKFFEALNANLFTPGGRIWYNSGRNNPQLLNCFVLNNELDSKEGWGKAAYEMIVTSMTGGGCGIDFSDVRPRGAPIFGQRGECPGPVSLMELIDNCAAPVMAGGSRRVALMFSLDLDHPDVEEFLDAKLTKGKLTHANVSLRSRHTKEFLKAVKNNEMFELSWKGKYKKEVNARDLWNKIVTNAYNSAEPGFLNWELVKDENNIQYATDLVTTNPSLRKGTKVMTSKGIFPIDELENKEFQVKNLNGELSSAKCFLSGKNKQLYRIKLSTNFEYYCTPEHKWPLLTKNGPRRIETSELCVGDKLPILKQKTLYPGSIGTYEDGFVVGWLYGDGWITNFEENGKERKQYGFIVSKEDCESGIDEIISSYLTKITGTSYSPKIREGCREYNVNSIKFENHFSQFGVDKKEFGLPKIVWNEASEEFRKGIIDALISSDGHISNPSRENSVSFTSCHKKLSYDLSELLGFYGIKARITYQKTNKESFPNGKIYDREYERYDVTFSNKNDVLFFRDIFSLTHKRKQNILESYTYSRAAIPDCVYIKEIELTDKYEDVWDISVYDETHCFQLSHCITGNCGEIALEKYGNCCLGHIVLSRFVVGDDLDWNLLGNTVRTGVRFLDNVLTVNNYPLPEMKENAHKYRRIGLGTTAMADMLALLGLRYGSPEANKMIDKLYRFISKNAYEASVMLSVEKGPFQACHSIKHLESGYMKRMTPKIRALVAEHGIRNCAMLTIAPTGTVSIMSGNCSSGIEPMFAAAYERRFWVGKERKTELVFHPLFQKFMEEGKDVSHFTGSRDLSVREHMEVQKIVQKHMDNAVSKTINIPFDYPMEDVSELWLEYLPSLKGTTFFREGSRGYVAENGEVLPPPLTALTLEDAQQKFKEGAVSVENQEVDCIECSI
jgi:ribonucleoside-diphosphate reductase alpha chain